MKYIPNVITKHIPTALFILFFVAFATMTTQVFKGLATVRPNVLKILSK